MNQAQSPLITAQQLVELYNAKSNFILIDARTGPMVNERFNEGHLEGALFIDLETQLSEKTADAANGGRHPLPPPQKFADTVAGFGIAQGTHVIVYDDKRGSGAAARFWWMLNAINITNVQVINGGMEAALIAGYPITASLAKPAKAIPVLIADWQWPVATINEVEAALTDKNFIVADVRDNKRYKGETEPIDLIAGHIPGAINLPFSENMDGTGKYLSPAALKEKYETAFNNILPENIIVHCGSGVTACHTALGMAYAGLRVPVIYTGSWSEWSRTTRPVGIIEDGEEKILDK